VSEHAFQSRLLLALSKVPGVRAWRQNVGTVRTADNRFFRAGPPKGAADISGIIGPEGWCLQIECKAKGKDRSPAQEAWGAAMTALGGVYLVAHESVGVEGTIERLRLILEIRRHPRTAQSTDDMLRSGL